MPDMSPALTKDSDWALVSWFTEQVEVNVKPKITKQVPRDILLYKKADWDQLKQSMGDLHKVVLSELATADIEVLWDELITKLQQTSTHLSGFARPDHEMVFSG